MLIKFLQAVSDIVAIFCAIVVFFFAMVISISSLAFFCSSSEIVKEVCVNPVVSVLLGLGILLFIVGVPWVFLQHYAEEEERFFNKLKKKVKK